MRLGLIALAVMLGLLTSAADANELDINFSNKAARLIGSWPVTGRLQGDAGWLHHTDRGNIGHVGLHIVDLATGGPHPIRAGLGGRVVYFDSDLRNLSGYGLPLGGFVRFNVPEADRIQVGGSLYYSPEVLTFGDGRGYREVNVYAGYEVLRDGAIYIGYRHVRGEFKRAPSASLDTGLHLGLRLTF
jgi:hypothetical protein